MSRVIFDDLESWVHFFAGFFSAFLPLILVAFVIYQWFEWEAEIKKIGDFIEFLLGWVLGLWVLVVLVLYLLF